MALTTAIVAIVFYRLGLVGRNAEVDVIKLIALDQVIIDEALRTRVGAAPAPEDVITVKVGHEVLFTGRIQEIVKYRLMLDSFMEILMENLRIIDEARDELLPQNEKS